MRYSPGNLPRPSSHLDHSGRKPLQIARAACLVFLFGLLLCLSRAEPPVGLIGLKELSIEELMQIKIPTVYGASKHEQKITDAPSSVTIVTREEIQAFGHRTLADVLRGVRDFYVAYDRNYGYLGVRGFNRPGDFGGRILMLVDGVRLNDPIYDSTGVVTDFPVDVDMIERVEVIRGPGSALYGNNAFFAVVDVITRKAADIRGVEASGEAGSLGTYKGRLTYGKVFNADASLLLSGTMFDSAGNDRLYFREFDQPANHHGTAEGRDGDHFDSAGMTITYKDFTLQSSYISRHKDVPTAAYGTIFNHPGFFTLDQRSLTRLSYARELDSGISIRADLYWNSYFYDSDYPYYAATGAPRRTTLFHDLVNAQWWGGEMQVSKQLFKSHRATLGLDYQDNFHLKLASYDLKPHFEYQRLETSNIHFGIYLQDEWTISSKLAFTAGLRSDWFESAGNSTLNPRGALIYRPWEKTTFKLLYGQAFRAPNVYEASYSGAGYKVNPDLGPERIKSYETALEQSLTPSLRLSLSAFYNEITGLISEHQAMNTGELMFENAGTVETKGGSAELEYKLPKGLQGRASYTLQRTHDTAGERVSNSPEHLVKLGLIVPLYRDKISSGLELQYSSAVENTLGHQVSGYLLANFTLFSRELLKNLEVSASVYNLFDKKYGFPGGREHLQESIEQDGRAFRLKLTYRF